MHRRGIKNLTHWTHRVSSIGLSAVYAEYRISSNSSSQAFTCKRIIRPFQTVVQSFFFYPTKWWNSQYDRRPTRNEDDRFDTGRLVWNLAVNSFLQHLRGGDWTADCSIKRRSALASNLGERMKPWEGGKRPTFSFAVCSRWNRAVLFL